MYDCYTLRLSATFTSVPSSLPGERAMACSSWSFPVTAKPKSPSTTSGALSPDYSTSISQSQLSLPQRATYHSSSLSLRPRHDKTLIPSRRQSRKPRTSLVVTASDSVEPLKVMISGAPASGKGTQCQLITKKYGLVHIAAGDLLRAEISAGSENGKRAKEYMEKGQLVPNEIVVMMVKDRLSQSDSQENGWLLDGYPRSSSQATALKDFGFVPDIFILLDVREEYLVERVVGRRLDPVTGRIYHLKYDPPETEEIAARLTQRFDDTEEKVKLRLQTHYQNLESVLSIYKDITVEVNGNASKEEVFAQIDSALAQALEKKKAKLGSVAA